MEQQIPQHFSLIAHGADCDVSDDPTESDVVLITICYLSLWSKGMWVRNETKLFLTYGSFFFFFFFFFLIGTYGTLISKEKLKL